MLNLQRRLLFFKIQLFFSLFYVKMVGRGKGEIGIAVLVDTLSGFCGGCRFGAWRDVYMLFSDFLFFSEKTGGQREISYPQGEGI